MQHYDHDIRSTERLSDDLENTILRTSKEPLLFGVFTFVNDTESLNVMGRQYSNNLDNYVMHSVRSSPGPLWLYDAFPFNRKMIIVQSLDNITDAINIGQRYNLDLIVYNIEIWERTPELERTNPSLSISKGAHLVHEAGYRYGIAPDAPMLMDIFKKINWTEIDFLDMQLQRFSQNVTEYSSIAEEITSFVRSRNPNIEIFTQVSFRFTDANEMIKIVESVKDIVDGFIIAYSTNTRSDSCVSRCSAHDLELVLNRINSG